MGRAARVSRRPPHFVLAVAELLSPPSPELEPGSRAKLRVVLPAMPDIASSTGTEVSPDLILSELRLVLASKSFANSPRLSQFMKYVVEQTRRQPRAPEGISDRSRRLWQASYLQHAHRSGGPRRGSPTAVPSRRLLRNGGARG